MKTPLLSLSLVVALALTSACHPYSLTPRTPRPAPTVSPGVVSPVQAVPISDELFAPSLFKVLQGPAQGEDLLPLTAGVIRRQLQHTAVRFQVGDPHALESLYGAFFLLRLGDLRPGVLGPECDQALQEALAQVGGQGDEGRSMALLEFQKLISAPGSAEHAAIEQHLQSLQSWQTKVMEQPNVRSDVENAGVKQRFLTELALLTPSAERLADASDQVVRWTDQGLKVQRMVHEAPDTISREEFIEASIAIRTGPQILVSMFLRYGDAKGAAQALEDTGMGRLAAEEAVSHLQAAASTADAASWKSVLADLLSTPTTEKRYLDTDLFLGGLFGAAVETFRKDPSDPLNLGVLGRVLPDVGLPEAVPLMARELLQKTPGKENATLALVTTSRAIEEAIHRDDLGSAARTFQAATPLLEAAAAPSLDTPLDPQVQLRMAGAHAFLKLREFQSARPLLDWVIARQPFGGAYQWRSSVERAAHQFKEAASDLRAMLSSFKGDPLDQLAIEGMLANTLQEGGMQQEMISTALGSLKTELSLRAQPQKKGSAGLELALARTLFMLGDSAGARRALERALTLSHASPKEAWTPLFEGMTQALLLKDEVSARRFGRAAEELGLHGAEAGYLALWLWLTGVRAHDPSEYTYRKLLDAAGHPDGWPGQLLAWMNHHMDAATLLSRAHLPSERYEALLYTTLASDDLSSPAAQAALHEVADAQRLDDSVESWVAAQLLLGDQRAPTDAIPHDLKIP